MGANLGITGQVIGNEIQCPFHGWQFDGQGQCTHIPYTDKVPGFIKTRSWHCLETNGYIAVWHDAEGREPQWLPPDMKEINSGRFKLHGTAVHRVKAHVQEIPENGADTAHLHHLHYPVAAEFLSKLGFHHAWTATWDAGKGVDEHLVRFLDHLPIDHGTYLMNVYLHTVLQALIKMQETIQFRGVHMPGSTINVDIVQVGPGLVHFQFYTPFGKVMMVQTVTPIQPLIQEIGHLVFAGTAHAQGRTT